ncbi:MAG: ATP-binding protein, partial [Pseudomonadota bacterium]|nr:ATP-binding protein [Pseudomonadota bacterium]
DDLLTLSRLESQGTDLTEQPIQMRSLLEDLAAEARALSGGMHHIELEPGPPAEVIGSGEELRSAFSNLISNAVRYTPEGGPIALRWGVEADGTGVFSVIDSGLGVAPEHIPRLTERFYRVDRSRSRATGGTGLGLAIVKHVLLRHESRLTIDSTPGCGSTFSVHLPPARVRLEADTADVEDGRRGHFVAPDSR